MRIIVFFDIPVEPDAAKRSYIKFRKFLLNNGFDMLQYSVYTRYCRNDSDAKKHCKRIENNPPKYGNVRVLKVTEGQFEDMILLIGAKNEQEKIITNSPLVIID